MCLKKKKPSYKRSSPFNLKLPKFCDVYALPNVHMMLSWFKYLQSYIFYFPFMNSSQLLCIVARPFNDLSF